MTTIRDVAQKAGVSAASVSRYFNGTSIVTDETSKKIEAAARELSYTPVCKQKNPVVIAIILSNFKLAYYSEVLKLLIEEAPKYSYRIVVLPVSKDGEEYKLFFKDLDITGVIYMDEDLNKDMLNYIEAKSIKIIMLGGISKDKRCKMIHINDLAAAHEGSKYLLQMHHQQILILSDYPKSISSGFQRITGCKRAYDEQGLTLDDKMIKFGELTYDSGFRMTQLALKEGLSFTAVFAFSDEAAMGVISALDQVNLKVPEDVSVLGFDGISISRQVTPKLTTIQQPIKMMVEHTLDSFQKKEKEENIEITLPYKIIEGGTCKKGG
ncbi:MAG: LacI family DNA-binding transcriptional regulator [Lachnospiraceae bacterium]